MDSFTLRLSKIVLIESLPDGEYRSGKRIHEDLQLLLIHRDSPVTTEYLCCSSPSDFSLCIQRLTAEVLSNGEFPLVHVEAHGGPDVGLRFANGEHISWEALCTQLSPLNEAMGLTLVVVVAACYGMDSILGISLKKPAPFFGMIAPNEKVFPEEIYSGFMTFYNEFVLEFNMNGAIRALRGRQLKQGMFVAMTAEWWFKRLMSTYLTDHATPKRRDELARIAYRQEINNGRAAKIGRIKRNLKRHLPEIVEGYFNTFFMIDQTLPNSERFHHVLVAVREALNASWIK